MKKTLIATGLALGLFTVSPLAAAEFGDWDADKDKRLTQEEFNAGLGDAGIFGDWDANDDSLLDENEFDEGVYGSYDANDDGFIDDNEWEEEGWLDF